jgi:outer membrane cobalamin receptor
MLGILVPVFGQGIIKIYGQVFTDNGPAMGVVVALDRTPYSSTTDNNGFYYFYNIPTGVYSLYCSQYSNQYKLAEKLIVEDGPSIRRDIYLDSGTVNVAPIVVKAGQGEINQDQSRIAVDFIESPSNLSETISKIPGLNVIVAVDGGEFYIAPNGARPDALEVYVDGRKINSVLTGKADLSQIPLAALKRVEYYPAGAAIGDNKGLAGRLNFICGYRTNEEALSMGAYAGAYGRNDYSIHYNQSIIGYGNFEIGWEQSKRNNDYYYTDYFGNRQTRLNADQRSDKAYFGYVNDINGFLLKLSGYGYDGSNGIPGKTITPSLNARSDKLAISAGVEIGYLFGDVGSLNLNYSYQNGKTKYRDLVSSTPYLTQYVEIINSMGFSIKANELAYFQPVFSISITSERLEGKDNLRPEYALGIVKRDIYYLDGGIRYRNKISPLYIEMGVSGNTGGVERKNYMSYSGQSTLWVDYGLKLGCNLSYGKSYRLPGLAELNWKEDVFVIANPDLLPERSTYNSIGIFGDFQTIGNWRFSAEYRDVRYKDLIYWRRSQGLRYKPVNIARSDYFGATFSVSYTSPGNIATIDFSRVKSISLNREQGQPYYGKQVIFQPQYVNRIQVSMGYASVQGQCEIQDVGQRYYLEENTKALASYTLINCSARYRIRIYGVKAEFKIGVENITDAEYELLEYQPMPPRTVGAGLTIKI